MSGDARAGPAARITRLLDRLADILVLVVEARIDLVEAALFRPAFGKIGPVLELLPRRPAVAAAGKLAESVQTHLLCFESELESADFALIRSRLRAGRRGRGDEGERCGAGGKRGCLRYQSHRITSSSARTAAFPCPRNPRNPRRSTRRARPPWRTGTSPPRRSRAPTAIRRSAACSCRGLRASCRSSACRCRRTGRGTACRSRAARI